MLQSYISSINKTFTTRFYNSTAKCPHNVLALSLFTKDSNSLLRMHEGRGG